MINEFFIGLAAVALGGYNLAFMTGFVTWGQIIPAPVGDVVLVVVGLFLWVTAYKLWRHRYHTSRMF